MKLITESFIVALVCILLFSCSSENGNDLLSATDYPVTLGATIEQQLTRSTSASSWDGGEEVAIQIGGTTKKYIAAIDGKLSAASTIEPFYWQDQSETKIVQGWYPYNASVYTSWAVQSDQSGAGHQASDLLLTPLTDIAFSGRESTPLKFYHQTAKVVINIKNAEAATSGDDIVGVKIGSFNNLALSGGYAAPAGNAAQGTWNNLGILANLIPKELTPTDAYLRSYAALVIPQDMTGKKFIVVTLANGNTYYYTPTGTDADLQGGKQYTYNITVKNGYLEVETQTVGEWVNGEQQAVISKNIKISYTATELKPGDYYYSDGTWSDGGLRRIHSDGTGGGAGSVSPINSKIVKGIVFWVGNPTEPIHNNGTAFTDFGDPALQNEKADCTHGLVVALEDVSAAMKWQNTASSISTAGTSYESIATNYGANDALNKLRGYNNTQVIRAYNTSVGSSSPHLVLPMQAIDNWAENNLAPVSSSGWYLPSEKELSLICGQDVNNLWFNNSEGTGMRDIVNASMGKTSVSTAISPLSYWSSSEHSGINTWSWYINFYGGYTLYGDKSEARNIRPILAF